MYVSVRKWRHKSTLGAQGQWQVEVGEPLTGHVPSLDSEVIKESCSNVGIILFYCVSGPCILFKYMFLKSLLFLFNKTNFPVSTAYLHAQRHKGQFSVENLQSSLPQRCLQCFSGAIWEMHHHKNIKQKVKIHWFWTFFPIIFSYSFILCVVHFLPVIMVSSL